MNVCNPALRILQPPHFGPGFQRREKRSAPRHLHHRAVIEC
jgi:hypothetical protein